MTSDQHVDDAPGHEGAVAHHPTDDHGEDHGHDDHAHGAGTLGPIDLAAWGAGVVGVLLGLAVVLAFYLSVARVPG